jgi:hypothetical protein
MFLLGPGLESLLTLQSSSQLFDLLPDLLAAILGAKKTSSGSFQLGFPFTFHAIEGTDSPCS